MEHHICSIFLKPCLDVAKREFLQKSLDGYETCETCEFYTWGENGEAKLKSGKNNN